MYTVKISRQHPSPSHTETDNDDYPLPCSLPPVGGVLSLCRSALSLYQRRQMLSALTDVAISHIAENSPCLSLTNADNLTKLDILRSHKR